MAAETKLDKLAVARLKAQLARNKAASQAQLQLAQADEQEANLSAMQKFRDTEKKRIEREAAAKAKLRQQGEGKAAPAPQLSPPSPINVENPASNLSSSPLSMSNFGQAGGPQPGSPGQQGGQTGGGIDPTGNTMPTNAAQLAQQAGPIAPYLQSQRTTQDMSLQETMPGVRQFVPSQRTTTMTEANRLSAESATKIQFQLAQARQQSFESYLDDLAGIVLRAEDNPTFKITAMRELTRLADIPGALDVLGRKVDAAQTARLEHSERHPRAIYDPMSPTGRRFATNLDSLGQPAPASMGSEIGGALMKAVDGLGHILRPDQISKIQEDVRLAGNALANLTAIRQSYRPEFLTMPEKILNAGRVSLEKLDSDLIDPATKAKVEQFADFRSTVEASLAEYRKAMSGLAVNIVEMESIKRTMPNENDSNSQFIGKWRAMERMLTMTIARNSYFLRKGLMDESSVANAIRQEPKLHFKFKAGEITSAEQEMLKIAGAYEEQMAKKIRDRMRLTSGKVDDNYVRFEARQKAAEYFGLPTEQYQQYFGE